MIVVFAGPTISHEEIVEQIECVCLPPVSQGDILTILPEKPEAIGIIDGYFEGVPSVWHKEILYALEQGVAVYGSSSMGALRAAELSAFGMVGVGRIYEWFRDGVLTDDDEVAVLHGPAEAAFMVASEPMVNIRATLEYAERREILEAQQMQQLSALAKKTHYKQRSWRRLFEEYADTNNAQPLSSDVKEWLLNHRVDLKKSDAQALLQMLKTTRVDACIKSDWCRQDREASSFHFEWTHVWDVAYRDQMQKAASIESLSIDDQQVLNQLRLKPDLYQRYHEKALLAWVCRNPIDSLIEQDDVNQALKRYKRNNQLAGRQQVIDHAEDTHLAESELIAVLKQAALIDCVRSTAGTLYLDILEQLKFDGLYVGLRKAARLKRMALDSPDLNRVRESLIPACILDWYFEQHLGLPIPQHLDDHLRKIGVENRRAFDQLILEEYLYRGVGG